ncbi:unnamed protein product, partial [Medioppia subpectinata]
SQFLHKNLDRNLIRGIDFDQGLRQESISGECPPKNRDDICITYKDECGEDRDHCVEGQGSRQEPISGRCPKLNNKMIACFRRYDHCPRVGLYCVDGVSQCCPGECDPNNFTD